MANYEFGILGSDNKMRQAIVTVGNDGVATGSKAPASAATVSIDAVVSVANTSTTVAAANANRTSVMVYNIGTQTVYLWTGGVATTGKFPLAVGAVITYRNQAAITGIVAASTCNVYVIEEQR